MVCHDGDLTDEGLLAELLSFSVILLPLEESESLVDERKDVHAHGLGLLLKGDSSIELLNSLLELVLVEEKLAIVVVDVGGLVEVLHATAEGGHRRGDGAHLVLGNTKLDVGEDEVGVEVDGLLVILGGLSELSLDEVELGAVVVDIRVLGVLLNGLVEVLLSLVGVTWTRVSADSINNT